MSRKYVPFFYSNKKGGAIIKILLILLLVGAIFGVLYLFNSAYVKSDLTKINKIANALNFYYGQYGSLPGVSKNTSAITVQKMYEDLITSKLVIPEDFVLGSVNTNLSFQGCQKTLAPNGKNYWKLVPLSVNSSICLVRDENKISAYGNTISDTSELSTAGVFMNSYLICQLETLLDNRNLYDGIGMLVQDGAHNSLIEIAPDFNCSKYIKDLKSNNEGTSSAYAFKVY